MTGSYSTYCDYWIPDNNTDNSPRMSNDLRVVYILLKTGFVKKKSFDCMLGFQILKVWYKLNVSIEFDLWDTLNLFERSFYVLIS